MPKTRTVKLEDGIKIEYWAWGNSMFGTPKTLISVEGPRHFSTEKIVTTNPVKIQKTTDSLVAEIRKRVAEEKANEKAIKEALR